MKKLSNYIIEKQLVNSVDRYPLLKKIEPLKNWLYQKEGLGLMTIIDEIFYDYGYISNVSQKQIDKFKIGLDVIKKTDMSLDYINYRIKYRLPHGIEGAELILDENGDYDHLNKLNTNYSALAELVTELIMRGIDNDYEKGKSVYDSVIEDPKEGLLKIKPYMKRLIIHYFIDKGDGINDFRKFTDKIKTLSRIGDISEDKVARHLEQNGFTILYRGGDGDFIDMIFGTDIIVYKEDFGYKSVQVKTNIYWDMLSHYKIDWVAQPNPVKIYNLADKSLVVL